VGADFAEGTGGKLKAPRAIWMMVPAGVVDATLKALMPLLENDDVVIDGGNSYYHDDIRRAAELKPKGIHYVDVGTSGGVWGAERGLLPDDRRREAVGAAPRPDLFRTWRQASIRRRARPAARRWAAPPSMATCTAARAARGIL
jgi:hypothetical protein